LHGRYWWAGQQKAGVEQMTLDVQKADAHAAQLRADNVAKREKLEEAERVLVRMWLRCCFTMCRHTRRWWAEQSWPADPTCRLETRRLRR
jgi:hypothetical protein